MFYFDLTTKLQILFEFTNIMPCRLLLYAKSTSISSIEVDFLIIANDSTLVLLDKFHCHLV